MEARSNARVAIRIAEESMLSHAHALVRAAEEYYPVVESHSARLMQRMNAIPAPDSTELKAMQHALAADSELAIANMGREHAAVERIGVDAILGLIASWTPQDRRSAMAAVSSGSHSVAVAATLKAYDQCVAQAERRYPPDDSARLVMAVARDAWANSAVELSVRSLQDLKAEATILDQHFRDSMAKRPSQWLAVMNEHSETRHAEWSKLGDACTKRVREALVIPANDPWPRKRRDAAGKVWPDAEEPEDAEEIHQRELREWSHGIDALSWSEPTWCPPFPDASSVQTLAERLSLEGAATKEWSELHAQLAAKRDEAVQELQKQVSAASWGEGITQEEAIALWSSLWTTSKAKNCELAEKLRASIPPEAAPSASLDVWASTQRTMAPALMMRRTTATCGHLATDAIAGWIAAATRSKRLMRWRCMQWNGCWLIARSRSRQLTSRTRPR